VGKESDVTYLGDVSIDGDVQKLSQIGHVQGDVFIIEDPPRQAQGVVDVTPTISLVVVSPRFGRKVRLTVARDVTVGILTERLIDVLSLPRGYKVRELELNLVFSYGITFSKQSLAADTTLCAAGITDGAEVELLIDLGWEDPITGKRSRKPRGGRGTRGGRIRYKK